MNLSAAIDLFIADWRAEGRINSPQTEKAYRLVLNWHADDVQDRAPGATERIDVQRTLARREHPNSRRQAHAILNAFYDWSIEEGHRDKVSPSRQVRRTRTRPTAVFRPTAIEVSRLMAASADNRRERWLIHIGVLAGLRRNELRHLQGRHFARDGWVWVSADIGKGSKERWMPVARQLEPVVADIREHIELDRYVFPGRRTKDPGVNRRQEDRDTPVAAETLFKMVRRVGRRAGLPVPIGPHTLRHAYGDHVARYAGLKAAQALMGHSSVETTERAYTGGVTLDELAVSMHGFEYPALDPQTQREAGSLLRPDVGLPWPQGKDQ